MVNDPQEHWFDMPDFVQIKQEPFAMVNVRFRTQEDMERFSSMTGIKLTKKTKSAWYPELEKSDTGMKRWK